MYTDASGVPFIISSFIFFSGNKRSGGMRCPVGIIQVTIVTNNFFLWGGLKGKI
jgi:hypothetical protein